MVILFGAHERERERGRESVCLCVWGSSVLGFRVRETARLKLGVTTYRA